MPTQVFMDAPLSLPGVYRQLPGCHDYFFREADRALRAMSPLFLGGLTARAMQLAATTPDAITFYETYPSAVARLLQLEAVGYKKTLPPVVEALQQICPVPFLPAEVTSWHHADALLAWMAGERFQRQVHITYGVPDEGQIYT